MRDMNPNLGYTPSKENAQKAGRASGVARRQKKNMQDIALAFLSMPADITNIPDEIINLAKFMKLKITVQEAILLAQINKAIKNQDTKAAEFVRDTAGQKPTDKLNMGGQLSYINILKEATGEDM